MSGAATVLGLSCDVLLWRTTMNDLTSDLQLTGLEKVGGVWCARLGYLGDPVVQRQPLMLTPQRVSLCYGSSATGIAVGYGAGVGSRGFEDDDSVELKSNPRVGQCE
ncbi:hypothetical protein NL676_028797 [Syzygium grande]|nr:hypothetical protein NL676_028797 [Syzygium grande]